MAAQDKDFSRQVSLCAVQKTCAWAYTVFTTNAHNKRIWLDLDMFFWAGYIILMSQSGSKSDKAISYHIAVLQQKRFLCDISLANCNSCWQCIWPSMVLGKSSHPQQDCLKDNSVTSVWYAICSFCSDILVILLVSLYFEEAYATM